ncbi:MAG: psrP1 [Bacteroidetes bacterium]|nr:MAG: psrP1 [Bacteroidota bacterium]
MRYSFVSGSKHVSMKYKTFLLLSSAVFVSLFFPAGMRAQIVAPPWLAAIGTNGGQFENGAGIRAGNNGKIYFGYRYAGTVNLNGISPAASGGLTDCGSAQLTNTLSGTGQWATRVYTGGGYDYVYGYNIDNNNNTYTTGTVNSGGTYFVTKTNNAGVTQWSNTAGSSIGGNGVCVDNTTGDVYACGGYGTTVNLGTGNLPYLGGGSDGFVVKYNSAGVAQWSVSLGGTSYDAPKACELDQAGNIYVVGGYNGAPTYGSFTLPASGSYSNLFIAKLSPVNGAVLAVYTATNAGIVNGGWYEENDLRLDSCGNIYVAGHFQGTANFGGLTVTSAGSDDAFVAKINPAGQWQWVRRGGGTGADQATGITLDKNWDVSITGHFAGTVNFSGSLTLVTAGNNDMFVAKYSGGNGDLMCVQQGGGPGYEDGYGGITADNNRQLYVTGGYSDNNVGTNTTNFGTFALGNGYYGNIYVAKLDSTPDLRIIPSPQPAYCIGGCYSLPYTAIGTFNPGNTFTVELSDPSGSFATGTTIIGTFSSVNSGTINICIPPALAAGSNYLLRVLSSSPAYCSIVRCSPIVIDSPPTVSVSGNATICNGGDTLLTAAGATSYSWAPSSGLNATTGSSVIAAPTTTTTYSVIGTNAAGCSDTAVTTITVSAPGTPAISGNTNICLGQSTTLTAAGSGSFSWSSGGSAASETVSPTITTSYTVTVTDPNGCNGIDSVTVNVIPLPVVSVSGATAICAGSSATLTATGGGNYAWSSGGTAAGETVSPSVTTTYTVTVTDTSGCSDSAVATVTVNPSPGITISGGTTICAGDSTILTATGGGIYAWNSGGSAASDTVSPATTTTLFVTVTDTSGCSATDSVTVTVNILPAPSITGNTTICAGQSTTLTASGGGTYTWSSGGTSAGETVVPATTSSYSVVVTDSNGCSATTSVTVTVNPLPVVSVSGNTTVCAGQSTMLTASGGVSYSWSSGGNTATETITPASTTTYTLTATDANGCSASTTATITVNPLPNAAITGNTTICSGQNTTLTATGSGNYLWSNGATTSSISVSPAVTTTYSITVTDPGTGCSDTSTYTVNVLGQPVASVTGNTVICEGASATLTAQGGSTYAWSNAQTTATISVSPAATTTYSVVVSNGACADTASVQVTVNPLPGVTTSPNQTIFWGTGTTLTATAPGGTSFSWSPANGLSCTNCANPDASPDVTTTYCVVATSAAGCSDSACVTITVDISCGQVFVPNVFSPNSDGQNDVLFVEGNCIVEMIFRVYDRWGEKVFESTDKAAGWDGDYKGQPAQTGVYVYQLTATLVTGEQIQKKGNVTILR